MRRRNFLRSGLALPLLGRLRAQDTPLVDAEFHLHPHYRAQTHSRRDDSEDQGRARRFRHGKISRSNCGDSCGLACEIWSMPIDQSSGAAISWGRLRSRVESRIVRPGAALEVRRIAFSHAADSRTRGFCRRAAFLAQRLLDDPQPPNFQVTRSKRSPTGGLRTRVRYELVGAGSGFHREQRVGLWDLEWEPAQQDQYRLRRWQAAKKRAPDPPNPGLKTSLRLPSSRASSYSEQIAARSRLLAHDSRRRVRHRHLRPQRRVGRRHRWRRLRRSLRLPARGPSQPAVSKPRRRNLRRHHRVLRRRAARKHGLRDLRRFRSTTAARI